MQKLIGVFGPQAAEVIGAAWAGPTLESGDGYALCGPRGQQAVRFDPVTGEGVLQRDPLGQRPLFTLRQRERVWFSDDLKTLLRVPDYTPQLNLEALHHFLSYQEVPAPLTLFAGINRLAPAHRQTWRQGRLLSPERYWKLDWNPQPLSEADHVEALLHALQAAVGRAGTQTVLLSGDVESSLLVALASRSGQRVRTCSLGPTSVAAREVSRQYGTDHQEVPPLALDETLSRLIEHHGEPRIRPLLAVGTPLGAALSGLGARALLGGPITQQLVQAQPGEEWLERYQLLAFTDEEKERFYDPRMLEELQGYSSLQLLKRRYSHLSATDPWNRALEADLGAFDGWSHLADELHFPFLDPEVVPLLAAVPASLKRSQSLLTRLGRGLVPACVLQAESPAPPVPDGLLALAERQLTPADLDKHGLFSPASVRRLQQRTQAHDPRAARQLLTVLAFQAWHRQFLQSAIPALTR